VIARTYDIVNHSDVLREFICSGILLEVVAALFGEPAVLF
jgi:hypothetical protein